MESLFKEKTSVEVSKVRKRKKKKPSKAVFIEYNQNQSMLLPPSLEELIPENHTVRTVNKVVETMNLESLINTYKGGGRSAYDPKMMLKVLVYAYTMKIYTSRRIAKALREDINFMWLSGMKKPDFRTINNFRSGRLKEVVDEIFTSMLMFLIDNRLVNFENYFVDGTKIDANANKLTYVWASNTKRYKDNTVEKIKELLNEIKRVNDEENKDYGDRDLEETGEGIEEITSDKIEEQVKKLNKIINKIGDKKPEKEKKKKLNKAVNKIYKKYLPKLKKYEEQEKLLEDRNSYSKTDKDATFFLNKSNQLLPGYNVIIGSENQIVVNYSIYRKASENDKFIDHIERLKNRIKRYPKRAIGDGTYGTEENYDFLNRNGIGNYLKYSEFYQEQNGNFSNKPFHKSHFTYNEKEDEYKCPNGKKLEFVEEKQIHTTTGYLKTIRKYKGVDCSVCEFFNLCSTSKEARRLQTSPVLEEYKEKARENLLSPLGTELRKQRSTDVETVFADIKQNQGFRRFTLRGYENVNTEFGLISIAHNIKKIGRCS